jgi:hypothetical protein
VTVDRALAAELRFVRLDVSSESRLFHELPPACMYGGRIAPGVQLLHADPASELRDQLPKLVLSILALGDGRIAVAGGAVLGIVSRFAAPGSDYDLFMLGVGAREADALLARILVLPGVEVVMRTGNAVTLLATGKAYIVQVILRLNPDLGYLLLSFDLPPCGVGAYIKGGQLEVFATRSWVASTRNMAFWVDELAWSESASYRIVKYYTKGFDVVVPGVERRMLLPAATVSPAKTDGIARLYAVERYLLDSRYGRKPHERLTLKETECIVPLLRGTAVCDYGACAKALHSMRWMVYGLVRAGIAWVRGEPAAQARSVPVALTPDNLSELVDWVPPRPDGRVATSFNSRLAKLDEAVDLFHEWEEHLQRRSAQRSVPRQLRLPRW